MDDTPDRIDCSEAELRADREQLRARLDRFKAEQAADAGGPEPSRGMKGMAEGFKIASEFIAGIAVGGAIGYGIDSVFGTLPFGLVIFVLFGFAAGVLNVIRATKPGAGGPPPAS